MKILGRKIKIVQKCQISTIHRLMAPIALSNRPLKIKSRRYHLHLYIYRERELQAHATTGKIDRPLRNIITFHLE